MSDIANQAMHELAKIAAAGEPAPSPCCKCAAYRDIIAEQAADIAKLRAALSEQRKWGGMMVGWANDALGEKK